MFDVVRVGQNRPIGEIIEMHGDRASIEVYEETAGLGRGDKVVSTGAPLSVELGPGLLTSIYDGIQRPLSSMCKKYGSNIRRGIDEPALDRDKVRHFEAKLGYGDKVGPGDVYGTVQETDSILHSIMCPPASAAPSWSCTPATSRSPTVSANSDWRTAPSRRLRWCRSRPCVCRAPMQASSRPSSR